MRTISGCLFAAALTLLAPRNASAVQTSIIQLADDSARITREQANKLLYCAYVGKMPAQFNPQSPNEGNSGVYRLDVALGPSGGGWGVLAFRTGDVFGNVDGKTLAIFEAPTCDSQGFSTGPDIRFTLPSPIDLDTWPLLPRGVDGTIYAPTNTHLVAIRPALATVDPVIAWTDVGALIGLPTGSTFDIGQRPSALMAPNGEILILIAHARFRGVVAVDPSGNARIVLGSDPTIDPDPIETPSSLLWDHTLGAAVLSGTFSKRLTFATTDPMDSFGPPQIPLERVLRLNGSAPVEAGSALFLAPLQSDIDAGRCKPSGQLLSLDGIDLDSDGLFPAEEKTLGTSILRADTDGDGAFDGVEAHLFSTSPIDPASKPPIADPTHLAPSTLISDWSQLRIADPGPYHKFFIPGDITVGGGLNGSLCRGDVCYGGDGTKVGEKFSTDDTTLEIVLTRDGKGSIEHHQNGDVAYLSFAGMSELLFNATDLGIPNPFSLYAVSRDHLYARALVNGLPAVYRILDGQVLQIASSNRPGCPVVANADELSRCGDVDLAEFPTITDAAGYDDAHNAFLLRGTDGGETWMVAVTPQGRSVIVRPRQLARDALLIDASINPLPQGGAFLKTAETDSKGMGYGQELRTLDGSMRLGSKLPLAQMFEPGAWFSEGLYSTITVAIPIDPNHAGGCAGGAFGSSLGSGSADLCAYPKLTFDPLVYLYVYYGALWVPTTPTPVVGEGIIAGREAQGSLYGLWRLGPRGQVSPWLVDSALSDLSAGAFGINEQSSIGQVSSAPDASRLCLVTESARGTWELTLDANHAPLSLTRVDAGQTDAVDCGYADDGTLTVLRESPGRLDLGGGKSIDLGMDAPRGLFYVGGRVVVAGAGVPSVCVDLASGAVTKTAFRGAGFADGPEGSIAMMDAGGDGFLLTPSQLCDSGAASYIERFDTEGIDMWARLSEGNKDALPTNKHVEAESSRLLMTEGGIAYIAGLGMKPVGDGVDPNAEDTGPWHRKTGSLLRVRQPFLPLDCASRLESLDVARRTEPHIGFPGAGLTPNALTVLGRGPLRMDGEDWLHRGLTPMPADPCSGEGGSGGTGPMPPGVAPPKGEGCSGCSTAESERSTTLPLLGLGGLGLLARRRRGGHAINRR